MSFVDRPGCRIYYEVMGDDPALPALVLVRGLGRSGRHWSPLVPELLPAFRIVLIDNRGVGRSDTPRPPYTCPQLADDVVAVMDAAGLARAHVFGMSLGGMIAQHVALLHRDRVERLVLGCTSPGGRRAQQPSLKTRLALLRSALDTPERSIDRLLPILVAEVTPELREQLYELARLEPVRRRGLFGQLAAVVRHDVYDRLADIAHPTLIITGDADALIPAGNSRLLAERIPRATLAILPGARHDFTTDRPGEVGRLLRDFLLG